MVTVRPAAAIAVVCASAACGGASPPATPSLEARHTPAAAPRPTPTPCDENALLAAWPLQRLAEQSIVVPVDEGDVALVRPEVAAGAGGVILFGGAAPANLAAQLSALSAAAPGGIAPLVMTDEEGGAVQRMANLVGNLPSARQMAATLTPARIQTLAMTTAESMRQAGITMDLAPVLDLDSGSGPNDRDPDGTRSFSLDPLVTGRDALAFARGLQAGGVIPVVKHFPGLGQASSNTDAAPATTLPWSQVQRSGLVPFEAAIQAGLPAVMVANASVPGLSSLPASIDAAVIQGVLRGTLGFRGLVMTDSLSAAALADIGYPAPRAVVAALQAGADMELFSARAADVAAVTSSTVSAIVAAVTSGGLSTARLVDAARHVLTVKGVDLCTLP